MGVPEPCPTGGGEGGATGKDWEVNQLCDVDINGDLIATVTQIFTWDELSQDLIVTLRAADDPTGPDYVVVGTLIDCPNAVSEITGTVTVDNMPDVFEISNDSGNPIPVNIINEVSSTNFLHGQNSDVDTGSDEQVVVASNPSKHGVIVKAMPSNTGNIYVGGFGVTTSTGFPLDAGESLTIPVDDANKVYVIADQNNQAVAWMAT